eukprot:gene5594-2615_t
MALAPGPWPPSSLALAPGPWPWPLSSLALAPGPRPLSSLVPGPGPWSLVPGPCRPWSLALAPVVPGPWPLVPGPCRPWSLALAPVVPGPWPWPLVPGPGPCCPCHTALGILQQGGAGPRHLCDCAGQNQIPSLPASFQKVPGVLDPIQESPIPVARVVPTAATLAAAAKAGAREQVPSHSQQTKPPDASGHLKEKSSGSAPSSRLQQETVCTLAKRRKDNLPGGIQNLVTVPPPSRQDAGTIQAPLTTYVPPVLGTHGASGLTTQEAPPTVQGPPPAVGRAAGPPVPVQDREGAEPGERGPTYSPGTPPASSTAADVGLPPPNAADQQLANQQVANQQVAEESGTKYPASREPPLLRTIRFDRSSMAEGSGPSGGPVAEIRAVGGSPIHQAPVTYVRLPEPRRFDVSKMK